MHLDDEQVQRFVHGEGRVAAPVADHLAQCSACRERVAEAEREEAEVVALLRHLDHASPRVTAGMMVARARARRVGYGSWAAGFALVLGAAGAAYAVPGSPVRGWLNAAVAWIGAERSEDPALEVTAPSEAAEPAVTGIAVPAGENLVIVFASTQAEGTVIVSLLDGNDVVVRARNGAATFGSDVDRLVVNNRGSSASFEIEIPRHAPRVEIHVGGRRVFLKEGSRITTAASLDARGRYLISLI